MAAMNRTFLLIALLVGCSKPAEPPRPALPSVSKVVACDVEGRWGVRTPAVEHWLYDPETKKERDPSNGGAKSSYFRDSLPFPQFTWGSGDFDVTQLVFPVGDGFMA